MDSPEFERIVHHASGIPLHFGGEVHFIGPHNAYLRVFEDGGENDYCMFMNARGEWGGFQPEKPLLKALGGLGLVPISAKLPDEEAIDFHAALMTAKLDGEQAA